MLKSISKAAATLTIAATCFVLLPFGQRVEAQSAGMFVNAVDLDIVPKGVSVGSTDDPLFFLISSFFDLLAARDIIYLLLINRIEHGYEIACLFPGRVYTGI